MARVREDVEEVVDRGAITTWKGKIGNISCRRGHESAKWPAQPIDRAKPWHHHTSDELAGRNIH